MFEPTPDQLDLICRSAVPYRFASPWTNVACHGSFLTVARSRKTNRAELRRARHEGANGLHLGVHKLKSLHPDLVTPGKLLLPLRTRPEEKPFQLVVGLKGVCRSTLLLGDVFGDYYFRHLLDSSDSPVLMAFTMPDLALLWSVGIPAVPATMIGDWTRGNLTALCELLGISRYGEPESCQASPYCGDAPKPGGDNAPRDQGVPLPLVLVDWSPAELKLVVRPQVAALRAHLAQLQTHLGIDLEDFRVWRPTDALIDKLRVIAAYGDASYVQQAMLASLGNDVEPLVPEPPPAPLPPRSYSARVSEWMTAGPQTAERGDMREEFDGLVQDGEAAFIAPLYAAAESARGPVERILYVQLANLFRIAHAAGLQVAAQYGRLRVVPAGLAPSTDVRNDIRHYLQVANQILALSQEIHAWDKPNRRRRRSN